MGVDYTSHPSFSLVFLVFFLAVQSILWLPQEIEDRTARNRAGGWGRGRGRVLSDADKADLDVLRDRGNAELDAININWIGRDFAKWMIEDRLMELLFSAEFLHTETLKR